MQNSDDIKCDPLLEASGKSLPMISVGESLRSERLKRNLELGQISNELKIALRFLEAIESEHFEKLPGRLFAKNFVRQYARMVDLDENNLVAQLQRMLDPTPELSKPSVARVRPAAELSLRRPRRWQPVGSWLPVSVAVVILVCSGVFWWWQHPRSPVAMHEILAAQHTNQTEQLARLAAPPATPATPEFGLPPVEASADRRALSFASVFAEKQSAAQTPVAERDVTRPAPTEIQNSELSTIRPTSISSLGDDSRFSESRYPVERQTLRAFPPPAPVVGTNSILPASLDQPPVVLESNTDKNTAITLLGPPLPPPATDATLHAFETSELKAQTYSGFLVDAVCATHSVTAVSAGRLDDRCVISATTALFALRLPNGRILQFDSVGNERVRNANRRNKWVATASSGKQVHAEVSGAVLGDKLIVVSIR
jgi:cytoskeleton protein RodZ